MFVAKRVPTCTDDGGHEAHLLRDREAHWTALMDYLQQRSMGAEQCSTEPHPQLGP